MSSSSNVAASPLRPGPLTGVAIDARVKEPPPADHPLFGLPNVMLPPHIPSVFDDHMGRIYPLRIENFCRVRPAAAECGREWWTMKGVTRPRRTRAGASGSRWNR